MNDAAETERVVVVCDRGSDVAAKVNEYLRAQNVSAATWYLPRDVDELDQLIRAGEVQRVIFPAFDAFLAVLWEEPLTLETWQNPSLTIEFVEPAGPTDAAGAAALIASWQRYQTRRRRAKTVAGTLLSAAAIGAAFTVLMLAK